MELLLNGEYHEQKSPHAWGHQAAQRSGNLSLPYSVTSNGEN